MRPSTFVGSNHFVMPTIEIPKTKEIEKVIHSPFVVHQTSEHLTIHRITSNDRFTQIDFIHYADPIYHKGGWVQIDRDTFIRPNGSNHKLTLVDAFGIPYAPEKHHYNSTTAFLCYTLYFPALPKSTTSIDIIEKETTGGNWFNFYGVAIEKALSQRLVANN